MNELGHKMIPSLEETIIYLVRKNPFYAHLMSSMHYQEDDKVSLAGSSIRDGKIYIHINTIVFNQLTLENRATIMVHEMLHIIGRHCARQQNRNQAIWNIACDIAINQMIEGIPIKQKVIFNHNREKEVGGLTWDNIVLTDGRKVRLEPGWHAEKYYDILMKKIPVVEKALFLFGRDLHVPWGECSELSQELADAIAAKKVKEAFVKSAGNIPSEAKAYIEQLLETRTPWRRVLQMFAARQTCEKRYATFKKQNKRLINEGVPGFKREKKLNLVVAVDTSGSVSKQELAAFKNEIHHIHKCGADITVIECDCEVKRVYKLKREIDPTFKGRGGTDFRPVWEYLRQNKLKPDGLIYLTDGWGQAPEGSKIPTLWALTSKGVKPWMSSKGTNRMDIEWGKFIKIETEQHA